MKLRWPMFCVLMVGLALPAASQEPTPPMRGRGGERVEEFKKIRMMDALKLDEETWIFNPKLNRVIKLGADLQQSERGGLRDD